MGEGEVKWSPNTSVCEDVNLLEVVCKLKREGEREGERERKRERERERERESRT